MNKNVLEISGVSVEQLAATCKTPLYVYDENKIRQQLSMYHELFQSKDFDTEVLYASKAFSCKAMVELVKTYGLSLDVVSGGELFTAYQAGFPMERVYFHGNNKSYEELEMAVKYGVGTIIIDNDMECDALVSIMKNAGTSIKTMLRVNPGVEAHTHKYIVTAHVDSKFGISILREQEIADTIPKLTSIPNITFEGFHSHIGSQIFDKEAYVAEIGNLCEFMKIMQERFGIT